MKPSKFLRAGDSADSPSSADRLLENIRDPQTYAIIGAAMEVHRVLGCGFLEPVYQEALAKEFLLRGIPFRRQLELPITYKGDLLGVKYKPDFICYDAVIVELKGLDKLGGKEKPQVINYPRGPRHLWIADATEGPQFCQIQDRGQDPMTSSRRDQDTPAHCRPCAH